MRALYSARMHGGNCSQCMSDSPNDETQSSRLGASGGEGGANIAADVRNVQTRLNCVDEEDGGPLESLAVDGICGPLTKAAIKRFQQRHSPELIHDGRIDRDRNTWKKLFALSDFTEANGLDERAPKKANPT